MPLFCHRSIVEAPAAEVFRWHERADAIESLLPSGLVRIAHRSGGIGDGARVGLVVGVWPLRVRWEARHFGYVRDRQFCDEQVSGPFVMWRHTHRVEPIGPRRSLYEDRVEYAIGGGHVINRIASLVLKPLLRLAFVRRHAVVRERVARLAVAPVLAVDVADETC